MESLVLTVSGRAYALQPLTGGQLEDLEVEIFRAAKHEAGSKERAESNRRIVAIGLSEDYPDLTQDNVRKLRFGTRQHLERLAGEVLAFAGWTVKEGASASGEGQGQSGP